MLSALKQYVKLGTKITIYVPATVNVNETIDNMPFVNRTAELLSNLFGGATSTKVLGYWVSDKNGLVTENTTMVFAYTDSATLEKEIQNVLNWAMILKKEMSQEAIALEINGEMYFI